MNIEIPMPLTYDPRTAELRINGHVYSLADSFKGTISYSLDYGRRVSEVFSLPFGFDFELVLSRCGKKRPGQWTERTRAKRRQRLFAADARRASKRTDWTPTRSDRRRWRRASLLAMARERGLSFADGTFTADIAFRVQAAKVYCSGPTLAFIGALSGGKVSQPIPGTVRVSMPEGTTDGWCAHIEDVVRPFLPESLLLDVVSL